MSASRLSYCAASLLLTAALVAFVGHCWAEQPVGEPHPKPDTPKVMPASDEGQRALAGFKTPPDLKVSLFAAEPLVANPVAICVDNQGKVYVAESYRQSKGVEDDRGHMNWLDDDLATQTVADRLAMYKKFLKEGIVNYTKQDDRIVVLEDRGGQGKADASTIFADNFNDPLEGTGAGVLAHNGNVYYTCIPNLWLLRDTNGDGKADERKVLQTGYGIRVSFRGHDLHGLRFGPDGKLYFSIGDRGLNVQTEGRTVKNTESGSVLRCNPDGSDLELVCTGLRNPQKLTFDQYGNLFTGDNNSDSGDKARWVYIVEGADNGWRMGYQYLNDRGPFNREKIWYPQFEGQAAYIVPPVANFADGPAGCTYYPGTGLPERYQNHFFLCDFRGGAGQSGVHSFTVKPKGASFEMVDAQHFVWSMLVTDIDFGPDGAAYITDWVEGWDGVGKGRIYKAFDPTKLEDPLVLEVKKLLGEGFTQRPTPELIKLLQHADMRVRQEAQFALADKGPEVAADLVAVAKNKDHQLARLHAIWALGQIGRKSSKAAEPLLTLTTDEDPEVRAQVARVLGDLRIAAAFDKLLPLLKDSSLRVQSFAAIALGKLGRPEAVPATLEMLRVNADKDAVVRHAGVMSLLGSHDIPALLAAAGDSSPAVRMGVLLTLRRLENPEVARFLNDVDPLLVLEAARAINDARIDAATPQLAALIKRPGLKDDPLLRRVLNANFRLGTPAAAAEVAAFAGRADAPDTLRIEALQMLADWAKPSGRDRVMNWWRPLEPRSESIAVEALKPALGGIFAAPDNVRKVAAEVAGKLGVKEVGPTLFALVKDDTRSSSTRVEALKGLASLKDARLSEATKLALADKDPLVRNEGRRALAASKPAEAVAVLDEALNKGEIAERQAALATLATLHDPKAEALIADVLDKLLSGSLPPELQLEALEAAAKQGTPKLKELASKFDSQRSKTDHLSAYRESMAGGDAERGRSTFFNNTQVYCVRCHKIGGTGGEVGPDLSKIAATKSREYLLEAIVEPNKTIAKGFETVICVLDDGRQVTGILKSEDAKALTLMTPEAKLVTVPKESIEQRKTGQSAMPADLVKHLTKSDIRDLVEFLSGLK